VAAYHHGGRSSAFSQLPGCGALYPSGAPHAQVSLHPRPRPRQRPSKFADAVLPPGLPRAPAREHPARGVRETQQINDRRLALRPRPRVLLLGAA
jgi:hypothetical protein